MLPPKRLSEFFSRRRRVHDEIFWVNQLGSLILRRVQKMLPKILSFFFYRRRRVHDGMLKVRRMWKILVPAKKRGSLILLREDG